MEAERLPAPFCCPQVIQIRTQKRLLWVLDRQVESWKVLGPFGIFMDQGSEFRLRPFTDFINYGRVG